MTVQVYLVRAKDDEANTDVDGNSLWWSNDAGWTTLDQANHYTPGEVLTLNLPDGGEWVRFDSSDRNFDPVTHRRAELTFRTRVWQEAGTQLDKAARLLVCALFKEHFPSITRVELNGEYSEDGELRVHVDSLYEGDTPLDEDAAEAIVETLDSEGLDECFLDMVASTGEDYLGTHEIDITEEGKYA